MAKKNVMTTAITGALAIVCIGNGLNLTPEDVSAVVASGAQIIVINDAWQYAPDAWGLYSADYRWWDKNIERVRAEFSGRLFTIDPDAADKFNLECLACDDLHGPLIGLSSDKRVIRHGSSSGFQALQLARREGATRVVLLGYDYGAGGQGHGAPSSFPNTWSDYPVMRGSFIAAAGELEAEGIEVVNCTRDSLLTCFRREQLEDVLESLAAR